MNSLLRYVHVLYQHMCVQPINARAASHIISVRDRVRTSHYIDVCACMLTPQLHRQMTHSSLTRAKHAKATRTCRNHAGLGALQSTDNKHTKASWNIQNPRIPRLHCNTVTKLASKLPRMALGVLKPQPNINTTTHLLSEIPAWASGSLENVGPQPRLGLATNRNENTQSNANTKIMCGAAACSRTLTPAHSRDERSDARTHERSAMHIHIHVSVARLAFVPQVGSCGYPPVDLGELVPAP